MFQLLVNAMTLQKIGMMPMGLRTIATGTRKEVDVTTLENCILTLGKRPHKHVVDVVAVI